VKSGYTQGIEKYFAGSQRLFVQGVPVGGETTLDSETDSFVPYDLPQDTDCRFQMHTYQQLHRLAANY
jgi:hypothetical protein